jgi:2-polyprenyl-3-methyl-5-hydroxy-6-metoxy-1,4-benzoquinol methylase
MSERVAAYGTDRPDVRAHVPHDARRILDIGCATGAVGGALKERGDHVQVLGVEAFPEFAEAAAKVLDRVVAMDAEGFLAGEPPPEAPFDCVIAADVLEHLVDPWTALRNAAALVRPGGIVVVSVPNVLFLGALWRIVRERRWPRDDFGIFDRTHLRWFSRSDAVDLLRGAGLRDISIEPRYFVPEPSASRRRRFERTPVGPFLPLQHILTGVR